MAEDFNVEAFLTEDQFTIPIKLKSTDSEGKPVERELLVTYSYDQEKLKAGVSEKVIEKGVTIEQKRDYSVDEQFALCVKKIRGVEVPLDAEFFKKMRLSHKRAMLDAIVDDVFPNSQPSAA